jgi:hypothetical protein
MSRRNGSIFFFWRPEGRSGTSTGTSFPFVFTVDATERIIATTLIAGLGFAIRRNWQSTSERKKGSFRSFLIEDEIPSCTCVCVSLQNMFAEFFSCLWKASQINISFVAIFSAEFPLACIALILYMGQRYSTHVVFRVNRYSVKSGVVRLSAEFNSATVCCFPSIRFMRYHWGSCGLLRAADEDWLSCSFRFLNLLAWTNSAEGSCDIFVINKAVEWFAGVVLCKIRQELLLSNCKLVD